MQCRTLAKQRPCGWVDCEREDCKTLRKIDRARESQTLEEMTEEEFRQDRERLFRLYRLIGGQPGYATFTVKQILQALNGEEK
jgi:hypothetical protein